MIFLQRDRLFTGEFKPVRQCVIKMQSEDQSMELDQTDGLPEF